MLPTITQGHSNLPRPSNLLGISELKFPTMSKATILAIAGKCQGKMLHITPNAQADKYDNTEHASVVQQKFRQRPESQGLICSRQPDKMVLREQETHGSGQHLVDHLDRITQDFKDQGERFRLSPSQLQKHCHSFQTIAAKCLVRSSITEAEVIAKFIYALPQGHTVKAMRIALKWRSFQEVYTSVMTSMNLSLQTLDVDIDGVVLKLQEMHI